MRAIVSWFNNSKGFGFARLEDGRAVFIHYSQIQMNGFKTLRQGQEVTLDLYEGPNDTLEGKNVIPE